jgi:hypothetical protein
LLETPKAKTYQGDSGNGALARFIASGMVIIVLDALSFILYRKKRNGRPAANS